MQCEDVDPAFWKSGRPFDQHGAWKRSLTTIEKQLAKTSDVFKEEHASFIAKLWGPARESCDTLSQVVFVNMRMNCKPLWETCASYKVASRWHDRGGGRFASIARCIESNGRDDSVRRLNRYECLRLSNRRFGIVF